MESNSQERNLISFTLSEKEVRENFLDFIIKGDTTPIDVACESTIVQITKQYYPVRCFYVTYSADWEATSIWEHKEDYTEYKTETVYIDFRGKEHDNNSRDYEVRNGQSTWHYRRPMQKNIPVKKTRTVVDRTERTYGEISDERFFQPAYIPSDSSQTKFAKWIGAQVAPRKYVIGQVEEECQIQGLYGSDDYAKQFVTSHVKDRAYTLCKRQVPGSRYEDFSISNFHAEYKMDIVLIPIFYITYSYNGEIFECWRSGTSEEKWYSHNKPQDSTIAEQDQQARTMIEGIRKRRMKTGLIVYLGFPVAILVVLFLMLVFHITSDKFMELVCLIGFVILIIKLTKYFAQFKQLNQEIKFQEEKFRNMKKNMSNIRKAIAEIVKRDDLNEEQQKAAIKDILNGNF